MCMHTHFTKQEHPCINHRTTNTWERECRTSCIHCVLFGSYTFSLPFVFCNAPIHARQPIRPRILYTKDLSACSYSLSRSLSLDSFRPTEKRINQHRSPTVDTTDRTNSQSEHGSCVCQLLALFFSSDFTEPLKYPLGEWLSLNP